MLDINFVRENLEAVRAAVKSKNKDVDLEALLALDERRRELIGRVEAMRAEQNTASAQIAQVSGEERAEKIAAVSELKTKLKEGEEDLRKVVSEFEQLLYQVPNVVSDKMPVGRSDEDNVTVRSWGEIAQFDFTPKEHSELGRELGLIDVAKAAEVSGSRFYYMKGDLVLMQFALMQFAFDVLGNREIIAQIIAEKGLELSDKPFVPMLPPVMIRHEVQRAIHRVFGDQTYQIQNEDLNLVASAEHTMAPYHMNEVLGEEELPKRYIAQSTAFRREAGTYGKDMGGIFRVHQFDKAEIISFTTAETGEAEQELIVGLQEYIMRKLQIPYRLQQVCTGDTGAPDYQQFDIEAWLPGQGKYRETHTSDYMTDYQMRGVKAFYKTVDGRKKLLHSNDATAVTGRVLVAIMENYQQADGTIAVPEVLRSYMGGREILRKVD